MSSKNKKNLFIIPLVIVILIIIVYLTIYLIDKIKIDNSISSKELSTASALTIGKSLYQKAEEAFDVHIITLPYCNLSLSEIAASPKVSFPSLAMGEMDYYASNFSSTEELKNYLLTYLSKDIVSSLVTKEAITDLSTLEDTAYNDYVIKDGKLYCRAMSGKGFLSRYSGKYDFKIKEITENLITYTVTLEKITTSSVEKESKCWYNFPNDLSSCTSDDLEYEDTIFQIAKEKDNWIVINYTYHY